MHQLCIDCRLLNKTIHGNSFSSPSKPYACVEFKRKRIWMVERGIRSGVAVIERQPQEEEEMVQCKEMLSAVPFYAENRRMTLAITVAC
jgi:hypothetical protein